MVKFLLWLLLLITAWPLAILALILYPVVWLLSLPFRLIGISVTRGVRPHRGDHPAPGTGAPGPNQS